MEINSEIYLILNLLKLIDMKKNIFFFFCVSIKIVFSQVFYVSSLGDDSVGQGTLNNPFFSIQKAIDFGASEVLLLEGVYTNSEIVTASNVVIKANSDDNVVFNGAITINEPGIIDAVWTEHSQNIYKTNINQDIWQLFIDEQEMIMARWPNSSFENDIIFNNDTWAHSLDEDEDGVVNDVTQLDSLLLENKSLSDFSNDDILGALLIANFGSFKTKVRTVLDTGLDISNNRFQYTPIGNEYRDKHHYYFLEGKLAFLDSPNEWFYENGVLYVWSSIGDGSDLENKIIRAKNKTFALNFSNSENITLQGIKFFASTVTIQNGNNILIADNVFSFPSYSKRMLGDTAPPLVTNIDQDLISGSLPSVSYSFNCTFSNNVFEYSDGEGLILAGDNHVITNNYFHHIDWSCAEIQGFGVSIYGTGVNMLFSHNVMHTTGASATLNLGESAKIAFNDISNTGLAQSDGAIVQITKNIASSSETCYNWLHDTEKMGFRFDAPSGSADIAGTEGLAHHNVIWNIGKDGYGGIGMMVKGDYHEIYNNTVFNCDKTDILILDENGLTNLDTYTENNAADVISSHRTNDVPNEDSIPGIINNNYSLYGDHTNNFTQTIEPLLNTSTALIYNSNSVLEDRLLYNFSPNDSLLIDQGKIINTIENQIETHPNVIQVNVTDGFQGDSPDIGAYEFGNELWIPGINFEPTVFPWEWPSVQGCTDELACNYNSDVVEDDGSCEYPVFGYDCNGNCLNDLDDDGVCDDFDNCPNDPENDGDGDGICESDEVLGCFDITACNYDLLATENDGSCLYPIDYFGVDYLDCMGFCVNDIDGDGVCDQVDNCMYVYNPNQDDLNGDGIGDSCDGVSLNEENLNKKLIKVFDILSREIHTDQKNSILLYIFDDGSVEKLIFYE